MICVQLDGGLGNQMFQYACGRALAAKHETELLLDCSVLQDKNRGNVTLRDYELDVFYTKAKIANQKDLAKFGPSLYSRFRGLLRRRCGMANVLDSKYLIERRFSFDRSAVDKASSTCFLTGYWQSELYFESVAHALRDDFSFRIPLDGDNRNLVKRISSSNSVGIHVRRGDYVKTSLVSNPHALCSVEYYQQAISYITRVTVNPVFFIFSDDPEWVGENLLMSGHFEVVSGNSGKQSYIDMQLMSLCRHNIIANSSFSWWGAWLNPNTEKIVIAPKRWYDDEIMNAETEDLIPERWIRL